MYSLCASFLGRICLSGDVDKLERWQEEVIKSGFAFYGKLSNVIKHGKTTVFGNRGKSVRHPEGFRLLSEKPMMRYWLYTTDSKNPMVSLK